MAEVFLIIYYHFRWTVGKFGKYDIFENFSTGIYGFCDFPVFMAIDIDPSIGHHVDEFFSGLRKWINVFSLDHFD
jgi:hypothetical protein